MDPDKKTSRRHNQRHNPVSNLLHLLAGWIILCAIVLVFTGKITIALILPIAAYCLHLIGHAVDSTAPEETLLLRKFLALIGKAPKRKEEKPARQRRIRPGNR